MRIGYLTYGLDRTPTGIGRYAVELLRALAQHPARPEIMLLATEREDPHGLWQQFETCHLRGCMLLPALMTAGNLALNYAARKYQFDLIHDPNGVAPFLVPYSKTKHVVTLHDAFAYVYPNQHNRLDVWRYRWMLPHAVRKADYVFTDSHHSAADLGRYLDIAAAKLEIVYCGIGDHFTPVADSAERVAVLKHYNITQPYILYVGGLNARKNIQRLFEAFAMLRQEFAGLKLVIGGKRQWQNAEMDAAFERLNLADAVHFTGYLDDAHLPAIYSAAAAFVFPSLYEGFGIPVLEAMACGTPVITSNVSSLPEVVGDAALLIDPYDVPALAETIKRVLTDTTLREELQRRGKLQAAQFTWQQAAHSAYAAYEHVLESS